METLLRPVLILTLTVCL